MKGALHSASQSEANVRAHVCMRVRTYVLLFVYLPSVNRSRCDGGGRGPLGLRSEAVAGGGGRIESVYCIYVWFNAFNGISAPFTKEDFFFFFFSYCNVYAKYWLSSIL